MSCKRILIAAVLFLLAALCTGPAYGQDEEGIVGPIAFRIGYGSGAGKIIQQSRSLIPVSVFIPNRYKNLTGRIEISYPGAGAGSEVVQIEPFQLPAPSKQNFDLLVRVEPDRGIQVRVVFDEKNVPVANRKTSDMVSAAKLETESLVLTTGIPTLYRNYQPKPKENKLTGYFLVPNMNRRELPERPLAYDGVHALFSTANDFSLLSAKQREAVGKWVELGGRLILLNPSKSGNFLKAMAPFASPDQLRKTDVIEYGFGYVGWHVMENAKEKPFWNQQRYFRQAVKLFPRMDPKRGALDMGRVNTASTGLFTSMTSTEAGYGFVGFLSLLVIIGAYILVIGPIDYLIVKRLKKPWLTWIIFLVAIGLFSIIAYWYSGLVHSGRMQLVRVNVLDMVHGRPAAIGNSLFWVYSTKNTSYQITTDKPNTHLSTRESVAYSSVAWAKINNGSSSRIDARIPIFSSKTFDATWLEQIPWQVKIDKTPDGEQFILPETLKIRQALIAEAGGILPLRRNPKTNAWGAYDDRRSWNTELDWAQGFHCQQEGVPDLRELEKYLLVISFANVPVAPNDSNVLDRRLERGARESTLDLSNHVIGKSRMLILFLEPESSLLPISLNLLAPESVQANVIRIKLPAQ